MSGCSTRACAHGGVAAEQHRTFERGEKCGHGSTTSIGLHFGAGCMCRLRGRGHSSMAASARWVPPPCCAAGDDEARQPHWHICDDAGVAALTTSEHCASVCERAVQGDRCRQCRLGASAGGRRPRQHTPRADPASHVRESCVCCVDREGCRRARAKVTIDLCGFSHPLENGRHDAAGSSSRGD